MEEKGKSIIDDIVEKGIRRWGIGTMSDEEAAKIMEEEKARRARVHAEAEAEMEKERKRKRKKLLATMGKVIAAIVGLASAIATILTYLGITPDFVRTLFTDDK